MKRIVFAVAVAVAVLLALTFLRKGGAPEEAAGELRIVSLAPNLTETVFDLGCGNDLVGVTRFCNYPAAALTKTPVGDFVNPSLETILELRPTLVLFEKWSSSRIEGRLQQLGLRNQETISPASLNDIHALILQVGSALDRKGRAEELVAEMKRRTEAVSQRGRSLPSRPSVYIEIDPPSWTVGGASYTSEAVFLAGGRNIFEDVSKPAFQASKETILAQDPEVILSFRTRAEEIARRPGWASLRAVREGRIIDDFNGDMLSRGAFRIVEGMESLQQRLFELSEEGRNAETATR
jgi:iron complex transport system substrate-binding protein